MAVCKRNNCMAQIGHSPAERILRLCPTHYQGRQLNSARRTERAALICQYPACGISISETRNQFYCCKEHRDKARRLIDDDAIIRLVKHSYWLNVEAMLKNNSLDWGVSPVRRILQTSFGYISTKLATRKRIIR